MSSFCVHAMARRWVNKPVVPAWQGALHVS
jgi:hypothetical protein